MKYQLPGNDAQCIQSFNRVEWNNGPSVMTYCNVVSLDMYIKLPQGNESNSTTKFWKLTPDIYDYQNVPDCNHVITENYFWIDNLLLPYTVSTLVNTI